MSKGLYQNQQFLKTWEDGDFKNPYLKSPISEMGMVIFMMIPIPAQVYCYIAIHRSIVGMT